MSLSSIFLFETEPNICNRWILNWKRSYTPQPTINGWNFIQIRFFPYSIAFVTIQSYPWMKLCILNRVAFLRCSFFIWKSARHEWQIRKIEFHIILFGWRFINPHGRSYNLYRSYSCDVRLAFDYTHFTIFPNCWQQSMPGLFH